MPCDSVPRKDQTLQQRVADVKRAISALDLMIMRRQARVVVGKNGAVTFTGEAWERARVGVTDACAYRRLMVDGSALTRMEIQRAESLAGVKVDRKVIAAGVHSHDGGATWHGRG